MKNFIKTKKFALAITTIILSFNANAAAVVGALSPSVSNEIMSAIIDIDKDLLSEKMLLIQCSPIPGYDYCSVAWIRPRGKIWGIGVGRPSDYKMDAHNLGIDPYAEAMLKCVNPNAPVCYIQQ